MEIFLSGEWGTVCNYGNGVSSAQVACRQLGYSYHGSGNTFLSAHEEH